MRMQQPAGFGPRPAFTALTALVLAAAALIAPAPARAQTFPTDDAVIQQMWQVGMEQSQTEELAHYLMDYIGPRLAGSENLAAAQEWLLETYASWGVPARKEQYGTWNGWREGITHVDMIAPWVRTLEAKQLAWSPPSGGPVEGEVLALPAVAMEADTADWLPLVKDKWVMLMLPQQMCRAKQELEEWARPETAARIDSVRQGSERAFWQWVRSVGGRRIFGRIQEEGALGIIGSMWSGGWGVFTPFSSWTDSIPSVDLSCEDYGLLYRLAVNDRAPRIRVETEGEDLGVVPQFNVIAELRGSELPDEYVLLGAHLDSWHGGTGATDNGTGSIMMLEAMRILKETYPNPRRTILVGHWGAEEMGLIGSGSFREDHPEVMEGMQAAFNQDNGTWRIVELEGQGFADAENHIPQWLAAVPTEMSDHIETPLPGGQENRGSDHISFICADVPSFRLRSPYPEYRQYTWHTNRDTYDKIVFDDLKENATLAAMLAYMASEDTVRFGRERAELPISEHTGEPRDWLTCFEPRREPRR
jgi:hypothetical protein